MRGRPGLALHDGPAQTRVIKRRATFIICAIDLAAWLAILAALLFSASDLATDGLDRAAAAATTVLLAPLVLALVAVSLP